MSKPYIATHIVHITDTTDIAAQTKIEAAYAKHTASQGIRYSQLSIIPAHDSLTVGTEASEIVNNTERAERTIIAVNYAPPSREEGSANNHRNDFFCAALECGTVVCGTSNGYEFSYVKSEIKQFYRLKNTNSLNSQFRSLQILPKHTVLFAIKRQRNHLVKTDILERIENVDAIVPSLPDVTHVLQIDNFGNVKLVPSRDDRDLLAKLQEKRQRVHFAFGKCSIEVGTPIPDCAARSAIYDAVASQTLFHAPLNTNVVAATSSSTLSGGKHVPIIATIRDNPGSSKPVYHEELPEVGHRVFLHENKRALEQLIVG